MGYDSDHPRAEGEVGKVGVAIDSIDDMRLLLSGLPLDVVTTSMTINATAAILLLLYQLVAEEQGVDPAPSSGGTIQNDILKEYVARGTYIYPPRPSMRLITDIFSYCQEHLPSWNTISISGYHIREAGSTAVQEIAFTLANGIAYVQAAIDAGLSVDEFAPRLSFFWNAHNNFFEEIAKYRAARRMWARIMTERFGAKDEKSTLLRFHTQTGGSTLTAQQPDNNVVRVTLQALAAVHGRHPEPAHQRLRRGPRAADGPGRPHRAADPADHRRASPAWSTPSIPLGRLVLRRVAHRRGRGRRPGSTSTRSTGWAARCAAIEAGFMQDEIEEAAFAYAKAVDTGEKVIVGVNQYVTDDPEVRRGVPDRSEPRGRSDERGCGSCGPSGTRPAVDAALADVARGRPGHPEPAASR